MNRAVLRSLVVAALLCFGPVAATALACPFCGEANAVDENRSKAFELSILFMLGMPPMLLAAFGYGFYRLYRKSLKASAPASHDTPEELVASASAGAPLTASTT
ncbi:MAG: hypothetical protein IT428_19765 [Planctomycetaceae bacterium]|nr:hypothetical protein [Planctomycetaceae bacterium]